jgi:hypothetical protein
MAKEEPKDLEARFAELAARNAQLMAALEAKIETPTGGGISADQLEQMLTRVTAAAAEPSNILARKLKPENADHLHVSAFEHKQGGIAFPKPELHREVIFLGRTRPEDLTYAETLAVNALSASLSRSQRRTCRDGKWKASVSDDDKILAISVPVKTIDDRQDLPSFIEIVQELTTGERALDQADIIAELTVLRAQIASLQPVAV